ncbi:MAG: putative ferredoxin [Monoraphidium minutum]|nr:MAG: putative ferredoxin [Monoraphidium minutum]
MPLSLSSTRAGSSLHCSTSRPAPVRPAASRRASVAVRAHKVTVTHAGKTVELEVPAGQTILEVALDNGIDLPHDCKLGVCMTCPAKLVKGEVDQTGCMLSEDVVAKGFTLLCMAQPQGDVEVVTCDEDELLEVQLCA